MSSQRPQQDTESMNCAEFQEKLPELFESGADVANHPHLKDCETCAALVRELQYIAAQAKLLLPIHDPSPAVWENIQVALRNEPEKESAAKHP